MWYNSHEIHKRKRRSEAVSCGSLPRAPDKSIEKTSGYVFARTTPTEITKGCDSDFTAGNLDRKNGRRAEGSRH
jgi:hypothetical protein